MTELEPTPTSAHTKPVEDHIPPDLADSPFIFIRRDGHNPPLQPKYNGPFWVIERRPTGSNWETRRTQCRSTDSSHHMSRTTPYRLFPGNEASLDLATTQQHRLSNHPHLCTTRRTCLQKHMSRGIEQETTPPDSKTTRPPRRPAPDERYAPRGGSSTALGGPCGGTAYLSIYMLTLSMTNTRSLNNLLT